MDMKYFGAAAAAALLLSGAQASAATVVIDDFLTEQRVVDVAFPGSVNSSTVAASAIGGFRTMSVNNTLAASNPEAATILSSALGNLSFSNITGATGSGLVVYDANGAGLNLSTRSNSILKFSGILFDNDQDLLFTATARDADGTQISFSEILTGIFNPDIKFTEFDADGGALFSDFDFENVFSLAFAVNSTGLSTGVDGSITSISLAPIPLPASAWLLLAGVGGMVAVGRRRKVRKDATVS